MTQEKTIHALKTMLYTLQEYSENEYTAENKEDPRYGRSLKLEDIEALIEELEGECNA